MNIIPLLKLKTVYPKIYKEILNRRPSYYHCNANLDDFLVGCGIGIKVDAQYKSDYSKIVGYKSWIYINHTNIFNKSPDKIMVIEDYKRYKSAEKAEKITTIYALNILEDYLAWTI